HQQCLDRVDVVPTHTVEFVLDQVEQTAVETLHAGYCFQIKGLQARAGTFRIKRLSRIRFDRHSVPHCVCLCDFSHLMRPNYGCPTKITLSDTLKTILLESNENLA